MNLEDKIYVGSHGGKSIIDIWKGNIEKVDNSVVKGYLTDFIDFLFGVNDHDKKVLTTRVSLSNDELNLFRKLRSQNHLRKFVIVNKTHIIINIPNIRLKQELSEFLISFFNDSHFSNTDINGFQHPENNDPYIEFTEKSKLFADMVPDPDYILQWKNNEKPLNLCNEEINILNNTPSYYPSIILTKDFKSDLKYRILAHIDYNDKIPILEETNKEVYEPDDLPF